ncbi:hypothetical protein O6H91_18G038800 [Diphasiastrum complanatum]|uniref:Uncharacterized protein n=1 Tax=Diphasiastrum complanatum TaxID=34168 RepID=A0ACC2B022_DIPCM|nr:hypothetical protein O6H91_18G038800 [Diphasiastrum complanatum]
MASSTATDAVEEMDDAKQERANAGLEGSETESGFPNGEKETGLEKESRSEVLARHQREIKDLQKKEISLKKAAAKGSKAEQKAKKKLAEEEVARLDQRIKARHAKELGSLGFLKDEKNDQDGLEGLVRAIAGVNTLGGSQPTRPSKSQKWRERRAQQEAERAQRIQEEQSNVVSSRLVEDYKLEKKLQPLGLTSKEIKPDGHCLYRAVEHQLSLYSPICPQYSYQQLRGLAASYMRAHAEVFLPFLGADGTDEEKIDESLDNKFSRYCSEVESSASWGGQLELEALAHSLKKHIVVFSTDLPDVEMGKEYKEESAEDNKSSKPTIRLSYHRHAFGLGEHYNSVVPLQTISIQDSG